jgi:hypothetical protein
MRRYLSCLLLLVVVFPSPANAAASPAVPGDPAVVSEWNAIAVSTLSADTTKAPTETPLYLGFVQAAVYNAVVGIEGRYTPYRFHARAPHRASTQAAAVAAAHRVLVTYVPSARATLDTAYATSLAQIPDGTAKRQGAAFGELAADTLISQRANDGRNASVPFTRPPGPGVWRPTPPASAPFLTPWLGGVKPLMVRDGAQFGRPGPPPALTSARYARDFNEVKATGSAGSTVRTAEQTAIALFFAGNPAVQYNLALRNQAALRGLDIVESARLFAAVDMSMADTLITVWHAKYHYAFWRPITAIALADTDGNPTTTADPGWAPLANTPPYPEYVSGYSGITGAFSQALGTTLDTRHLRLELTSTAVPGATRAYDSAQALNADVIDARVWLGFHFRFADTGGVQIGQRVAGWSLDRYFRPIDHD